MYPATQLQTPDRQKLRMQRPHLRKHNLVDLPLAYSAIELLDAKRQVVQPCIHVFHELVISRVEQCSGRAAFVQAVIACNVQRKWVLLLGAKCIVRERRELADGYLPASLECGQ